MPNTLKSSPAKSWPKSCPRCGAGLSAQEAVQGLCAGCLLVAGLDSRAEGASAPRQPAPSIEALAPHFPDLELVELVGQGGMGAVYRVKQKKLARFAALKILALDGEATPAFAERFEREARTLASLGHENIVAIYDQGRAGPHWYLLMEYVDGVSLRQMIRAREVDPRTALGLVAQICDALQCAHDRGVVHRDVKPENVLVDRRGRVKILDFGLAKLLGQEPRTGTLTETGQVMGTPRYMAPEQWERPLTVDHRADIYAVGVVFYELLTGELPIGAFQLPSHFAQVDARVDPVVMKTLAKEPERRYQHASEVSTDVQRIATEPTPDSRSTSTAKGERRLAHKLVFAAIGCLLFAVLVFLGLILSTIPARETASRSSSTQTEAELAAAEATRTPAELLARERRIDELPGPRLWPPSTQDADGQKLWRAQAKLDALWRAYLSFEERHTRVTTISPGSVRVEVSRLHEHELASLAAFANALYEPTTLEHGAGDDSRYRVTTPVASVDRLSPPGPGAPPRVSFAAPKAVPSRDSRATLSEFLGGPNALSQGWFPTLTGDLELAIRLDPLFVAEITISETTLNGSSTFRTSFDSADVFGANGYGRFVELARGAVDDLQPR